MFNKFVILFLILINPIFAQNKMGERPRNADAEVFTNFKEIKEVLENDQLSNNAAKIVNKRDQVKKKKIDKNIKSYDIPGEDQFWPFMSEMWIVKSTPKLKWNFEKPDYGLDEYFAQFLEELGNYEVKFKILLLDTALVTHFSLPSSSREKYFLLSVPFIRVMDLTKLEISILLLEDFLRDKLGQFKNKVSPKGLENQLGGNFYKKKLDMKVFDEILKNYDKVVFENGFTFKEQFSVTKQMENMLRGKIKYWKAYLTLLEKISNLVKRNTAYKDYNKIYPSPDLQINWLKPKKKVL